MCSPQICPTPAEAGDVGTVVHVHANGLAYEVEFATLTGTTVAVATVPVEHLRAIAPQDMDHVRVIAGSVEDVSSAVATAASRPLAELGPTPKAKLKKPLSHTLDDLRADSI